MLVMTRANENTMNNSNMNHNKKLPVPEFVLEEKVAQWGNLQWKIYPSKRLQNWEQTVLD